MCLHVPGGNYLPHFDAFPVHLHPQMFGGEDDLWVGNGIAMFMFYLSNLVGGATVFPNIGIVVSTSGGTAVPWKGMVHLICTPLMGLSNYSGCEGGC